VLPSDEESLKNTLQPDSTSIINGSATSSNCRPTSQPILSQGIMTSGTYVTVLHTLAFITHSSAVFESPHYFHLRRTVALFLTLDLSTIASQLPTIRWYFLMRRHLWRRTTNALLRDKPTSHGCRSLVVRSNSLKKWHWVTNSGLHPLIYINLWQRTRRILLFS
jgi:hypothetical protein